MISDADHGAGEGGAGGNDVGAVDPDVAGFQARSAARRDFDYRKSCGRGLLGHAVILMGESSIDC